MDASTGRKILPAEVLHPWNGHPHLSADVGSTSSAVKSAVAENVKGIRLPPVRTMVKIGVALLVLGLLVLLYFFKG